MKFTKQITINAPAEKVWGVLGRDFANIGVWSRSVSHSAPNTKAARVNNSPVGGRVCNTSFGDVSEEFTAYDLPITMAQIAGGGTDFTDAFDWVERNNINPSVFVYFSDLDGGCSAPDPWYPVIWVSTTSLDEVPFGEVIHMYPKA